MRKFRRGYGNNFGWVGIGDVMPARETAEGILLFVAALATAIALGAALAHAFELANKIGLPREQYFVVQQAYRGWNRRGHVLLVELASLIALIFVSRHRPEVFWPSLAALACLIAAQAIFWTFTYPANVAAENWTVIPDDWQACALGILSCRRRGFSVPAMGRV